MNGVNAAALNDQPSRLARIPAGKPHPDRGGHAGCFHDRFPRCEEDLASAGPSEELDRRVEPALIRFEDEGRRETHDPRGIRDCRVRVTRLRACEDERD